MEVMFPFVVATSWTMKDLISARKNRISFKEKINVITCFIRLLHTFLLVQAQAQQFMIDDLRRTEENVASLLAGCRELNVGGASES
jgi:hypothetical protein